MDSTCSDGGAPDRAPDPYYRTPLNPDVPPDPGE